EVKNTGQSGIEQTWGWPFVWAGTDHRSPQPIKACERLQYGRLPCPVQPEDNRPRCRLCISVGQIQRLLRSKTANVLNGQRQEVRRRPLSPIPLARNGTFWAALPGSVLRGCHISAVKSTSKVQIVLDTLPGRTSTCRVPQRGRGSISPCGLANRVRVWPI